MSVRNVRVDIPVGSIDNTIKLADKIDARHLLLGPAVSPLEGQIDMTAFNTLIAQVKLNRTPAIIGNQQKQAWNDQSLGIIGIGPGRNLETPGTVYWYISKVHKFLAFKFKGNEEQASLWGFDVQISQTAGRRNVNFNLPYGAADKLLALSTAIISKHTTDGPGSILIPSIIDMADFEAKHNQAFTLRDDAENLDEAKQASNQLARNQCGYGIGQTTETPNTLYWYITQIRNLLLIVNDGNEQQLELWGYNVVVS